MRWLRLTFRQFARRPLFPAISLVILSLGLAASIAAFAYTNSFAQSFPGVEADGLVQVFGTEEDLPFTNISFMDFEDYARSSRSFSAFAAVQPYYAASVRHEDMTEVAFLEAVTGEYFDVLGTSARIGRLLGPEDDRIESETAAVISHEWWMSRWSGNPYVLGQTLYLNYRPFTIVGVAAPEFIGSSSDFRPGVWIPVSHFRDRYTRWDALAKNRDVPLVRVLGRLAPGVDVERATSELQGLANALDSEYPRQERSRRIRVQEATWIDPRARIEESSNTRHMVLAAGGFLILVCANVANLLLSIFSLRRKEFALQAAIGATPGRILRGIIGQNLVLSIIAGLLALGLAIPLSDRLGSYFARPSIWGENVSRVLTVDGRVVVFALLASVVTGVVAAGLPALETLRRGVSDILKSDASTAGAGGTLFGLRLPGKRDLLMSAQVALSIVLLVVSGLVLKTLSVASTVDPGFEYSELVGSHVSTSSTGVQPEGRERFFRDLEERIAREPWVRSATVSGNAPLSGHPAVPLRPEGSDLDVTTVMDRVHQGFFGKLGVDVVEGRPFAAADTMGGGRVAILSREAADRLFDGRSAVGRRVAMPRGDDEDLFFEVVGVSEDMKLRDFLAPPEPIIFLPYSQQPYPTGSALLVNTTLPPDEAVPLLQRWLRAYEPHLAIVNAITYREVVRGALYTQRMNAELFTGLAVLGLVLACAGIFSVVSLSVTRRTREIGIRKAIGATSGAINTLVVRQAMVPVLVGGVVGLLGALAGSRLLSSLLYDVNASDPIVLLGGLLVLLSASAMSAYGPAFRASRLDAAKALRTK